MKAGPVLGTKLYLVGVKRCAATKISGAAGLVEGSPKRQVVVVTSTTGAVVVEDVEALMLLRALVEQAKGRVRAQRGPNRVEDEDAAGGEVGA